MELEVSPGLVLGDRYRLIARAHQDVFGDVWTARDTQHDRLVSVRALAPEIGVAPGSSPAVLALSHGEGALRHPNVASVLDVICEDERWYLVSETATGETLANLITARGPFSPTSAFKLALEVAEGLRAIHERGAFHGRLDPTRVVILGDKAKLVDVGLGMLLGDDSEEWRTTIPDMNDPTVAFLSPEQASGDGPPTEESDVWALGAILYFATFGSVPYLARTRAELAVATARRLVSLDGARDRSLAALIAPCMAREPALRPAVTEFLEDARAAYEPSLEPGTDNSIPGASLSILDSVDFRPRNPVVERAIELSQRVPRAAVFGGIFALFLMVGLALRGNAVPPPAAASGGLPALATEIARPAPTPAVSTSASTSASTPILVRPPIRVSDNGTVAH